MIPIKEELETGTQTPCLIKNNKGNYNIKSNGEKNGNPVNQNPVGVFDLFTPAYTLSGSWPVAYAGANKRTHPNLVEGTVAPPANCNGNNTAHDSHLSRQGAGSTQADKTTRHLTPPGGRRRS